MSTNDIEDADSEDPSTWFMEGVESGGFRVVQSTATGNKVATRNRGDITRPINTYHSFMYYVKYVDVQFIQLLGYAFQHDNDNHINFDLINGTMNVVGGDVADARMTPTNYGGFLIESVLKTVTTTKPLAGINFVDDINAARYPDYSGPIGGKLEIRRVQITFLDDQTSAGIAQYHTKGANKWSYDLIMKHRRRAL